MKTEKPKKLIRWYILGAIGAVLMAAGDWLLGCVPLQKTDTSLFNRACYLSGSYGLWRPVLTVGLGAIGGFLYYFMIKALNADIDEKYRKIMQSVQNALGNCSRQSPAEAKNLKDKMHAVKSMERRFEKEDENMTEMPEQEEAIFFQLSNLFHHDFCSRSLYRKTVFLWIEPCGEYILSIIYKYFHRGFIHKNFNT